MKRRRRGPGAVTLTLAIPLAALAYFLAAPLLPALPAGDATVLVAGSAGLLVVAASTLALLPAYRTLVGPLFVVLGAGLLVAALNVADAGGVGAGANVVEALLASAVGLLLARWLEGPLVAVAVALFVAAVDIWSVASGPSSQMLAQRTDRVDPLSFDLPAWGGAGSAGHLGLSDAVFLSMFAAWAQRYGFRGAATLGAMVAGLLATLGLSLALDTAIPALPFIAAGFLLPNADRVLALLRART